MPFDGLSSDATGYATTFAATSMVDVDAATTSSIWTGWQQSITYTMTTGEGLVTTVSVSNPPIWNAWNGTATSSATTSAFNASMVGTANTLSWTGWQNQPYSCNVWPVPRIETEEERVEAAARAELRRQAAATRAVQRTMAIEKADKLLDSVLNDAQREHLARYDWFLLKGRHGTIYRIRRGRSANVDVLNKEGVVIQRLCAHPAMAVPDGDTMVAQKLMLEADPEEFLRIANRHGVRDVPAVPREIMEELLN